VLTADSIVDVRLSAGADRLGGAGEPAGVCFEGSAETAEMRCQSAAGEVGLGLGRIVALHHCSSASY
jgi:hypothetical protein